MRPVGRFVALAFLLVCCAVIGAEPARIPADQLAKAIRNDSISIPTPGELFAALEKPGKPNWVGQMRGPVGTTYKNRAQIALNLGSLIAEGAVKVLVDSVFPLEEAAEAHRRLESGGVRGKIVLSVR